MIDVLRLQKAGCEQIGSALYGRVLDGMIADFESGGVVAEVVAPWTDDALADAIPLRLLGAVHRIVLDGRAPDLAAYYPSAGGTDRGNPVPAFLATVRDHRAEVADGMHHNVQTNEVGRACSLVGGFHTVSRRTGLPLRILEVGASAGLLLRWDKYRYETATRSWGGENGGATLTFTDPFVGPPPVFDPQCSVVARKGCDVNPIDITSPDGVLTLRSFLWPDQVHRRSRLDQAIEIARRHPAVVERADAGDWVAEQLAEPVHGVATVIYHSIVLQYLPRASFVTMREAIIRAGQHEPAEAPVFWLRMEPAGEFADIRLRSGSGSEEILGTTGYHGPPVTWAG